MTSEALHELDSALREFHRALVSCAQREYEREYRVVLGAGELLQLLAYDSFFDWLRPLSTLMAQFQDLPDERRRSEIDRVALAQDAPLWRRYAGLLATDPQLAMAYSRVKRANAKV